MSDPKDYGSSEQFHAHVAEQIGNKVPGYAQVRIAGQTVSVHPLGDDVRVFTGTANTQMRVSEVMDAVIDWTPDMTHSKESKSKGTAKWSPEMFTAADFRKRSEDLSFADSKRLSVHDDDPAADRAALRQALDDYADARF